MAPAVRMVRASSPALAASRRMLMKPGPAISALAMPGFWVSRSVSSWARARGLVPAFLASCMATLVAQSPWSRLRGRSTLGSGISSLARFREPSATSSCKIAPMAPESSSGVTFNRLPFDSASHIAAKLRHKDFGYPNFFMEAPNVKFIDPLCTSPTGITRASVCGRRRLCRSGQRCR